MGEHKNEALELLKSIRRITEMIEELQEEIARIYAMLTSTTVKAKTVDVQTSLPEDPMGTRVAEIIEYQEQLENYQKELCNKKCQVLITLKNLDVEEQRVLLLRYFKVMSIEKVAEEMEWSYYWTWQKLHKAEESFCEHYQMR